jgi:hypothetical protein
MVTGLTLRSRQNIHQEIWLTRAELRGRNAQTPQFGNRAPKIPHFPTGKSVH